MATPAGPVPTAMGRPTTALVAVSITETLSELDVSYVGLGAVGGNGHPEGTVADGNGKTNYGVSSGADY